MNGNNNNNNDLKECEQQKKFEILGWNSHVEMSVPGKHYFPGD